MRVHCSAAGSGAKREPNMRNCCRSFRAPIRSAPNCGFSNAASRSAAEFLRSLRSKSATPMLTPRDFSLSLSITAPSRRIRRCRQAVESAATRAPQSRWAEQALFLAGNYYWVQLDRDRASGYYKRVADNFPTSPDAVPSQWRVAWTAVLKRTPDAASLLTDYLRRFPGSQFTPDALYWLGRLAEEAAIPHSRALTTESSRPATRKIISRVLPLLATPR